MTIDDVVNLINENEGIINFGSPENAIDGSWILKAERRLGFPLSDSYKWFIQNYSGGEIGSEEIYSLYGIDFETANGGDIVYQHIVDVRNGVMKDSQLVVSETDFGEVYFFDTTKFNDGEYPIYLQFPPGKNELYANNFYEFLYKRINAHI